MTRSDEQFLRECHIKAEADVVPLPTPMAHRETVTAEDDVQWLSSVCDRQTDQILRLTEQSADARDRARMWRTIAILLFGGFGMLLLWAVLR